MRKRCGFLMLLSLAGGLTGCAATKMGDGSPTFGTQAWNQSPAPPQRTIANIAPTADPVADAEPAAKPVGLAKYFPGLQRSQIEPPRLVTRYRPTWFGLRPNPAAKPPEPTTYMTDARADLARPYSEPATLPVALQVPSATPASDGAVQPTNAEQSVAGINPTQSPATATPDQSSTSPASKPGDGAANPLPTALGSSSPLPGVVDRTPDVPPVDPRDQPRPGVPDPAQSSPSKPATNTTSAPTDDDAYKAITPATNPNVPPGLPNPTVPASYSTVLVAQQAVGFKKLGECKVFASPQSPPKPSAKPTPQSVAAPKVKPSTQAVPTSLAKPSPQATASAQTCATDPAGATWQRPCLRRLIRKCFSLGEYADPPTAAPH